MRVLAVFALQRLSGMTHLTGITITNNDRTATVQIDGGKPMPVSKTVLILGGCKK